MWDQSLLVAYLFRRVLVLVRTGVVVVVLICTVTAVLCVRRVLISLGYGIGRRLDTGGGGDISTCDGGRLRGGGSGGRAGGRGGDG